MLKFDVTVMEEGKGNITYRGVEGICKGDAMREMLNLHRDLMKVPGGIELVAKARVSQMNEVKWYERGDIGDQIRDLLDYYDVETCASKMKVLGLSDDEISDVILKEEEWV